MQTVTVIGARRDDGSAQVCLWANLPGVGEVFVVSGQTITLPLTTDVTNAIAQGRLVVLPEQATTEPEPEAPADTKPTKRGKT